MSGAYCRNSYIKRYGGMFYHACYAQCRRLHLIRNHLSMAVVARRRFLDGHRRCNKHTLHFHRAFGYHTLPPGSDMHGIRSHGHVVRRCGNIYISLWLRAAGCGRHKRKYGRSMFYYGSYA